MDTTEPGLPGDPRDVDIGPLIKSRYEILQELGRGGMGRVYRARHRVLGVEVAIKVIRSDWPTDRFLREAKILAKINSPHVVAVRDYEVLPNGMPILVMEWVDGDDLNAKMQSCGGRLSEGAALPWMKQVCDGMREAAEQGIIHRDLKPSNIIVDSQQVARVADFGLARAPEGIGDLALTEESVAGNVMGTPYYMSPEQAEDPRRVDTRSDIYSFGATFYHALTGNPPFDGSTAFSILFKHKSQPVISPKARSPEIGENVSQILERCLAKSPSDRFQSFAELSKYLESTAIDASPWDDLHDQESAAYISTYRSRRDDYLHRNRAKDEPDVYDLPSGCVLKIQVGDITQLQADAIVSCDRADLSMKRGVAAAIRLAAGPLVEQQTRMYSRVRPGRAVVTSGGQLKSQFIFHGVTLDETEQDWQTPSRDIISEIMKSCFYHANSLHVKSIAFPLLGMSDGDFPQGVLLDPSFRFVYRETVSEEICLDTMFRFLLRTLLRGVTAVQEATIVLDAR